RELVVVRLGPVGRSPVNEQHDGDRGVAAHAVEQLPVRIAAELIGQLPAQMANRPADGLRLAEDVGVEPRAPRIAYLLLALGGVEQRFRQAASGAEEVDLEYDHVLPPP